MRTTRGTMCSTTVPRKNVHNSNAHAHAMKLTGENGDNEKSPPVRGEQRQKAKGRLFEACQEDAGSDMS